MEANSFVSIVFLPDGRGPGPPLAEVTLYAGSFRGVQDKSVLVSNAIQVHACRIPDLGTALDCGPPGRTGHSFHFVNRTGIVSRSIRDVDPSQ